MQHTLHRGYRADGEDWGGHVAAAVDVPSRGRGAWSYVQALESGLFECKCRLSTDSLCGFSDLTFSYSQFPLLQNEDNKNTCINTCAALRNRSQDVASTPLALVTFLYWSPL